MNLCAIIAEFNPLTNGHQYLIDQAKKQTGLDVAIIMGGNFLQRGNIACLDKYTRSLLAIKAGAKLVFALPTFYAISSAKNFARGAIKCLKNLPVSHLAFGVELDDFSTLTNLEKTILTNRAEIDKQVKIQMKEGCSFSSAMFNSLNLLFPSLSADVSAVFNSPNNILALEYLLAIDELDAKIEPVFVRRTDNGYNSSKIKHASDMSFASASHVRNMIENNLNEAKKLVPSYCFECLKNISLTKAEERLSAIVIDKLRSLSKAELLCFHDYTPPFASVIEKCAKECATLHELCEKSKSKSSRASRIGRLVLYPYFNLTKQNYKLLEQINVPINVLAVDKTYKKELSLIKKSSESKILISLKDYDGLDEVERLSAQLDQIDSNLYSICAKTPYVKNKTIFV